LDSEAQVVYWKVSVVPSRFITEAYASISILDSFGFGLSLKCTVVAIAMPATELRFSLYGAEIFFYILLDGLY